MIIVVSAWIYENFRDYLMSILLSKSSSESNGTATDGSRFSPGVATELANKTTFLTSLFLYPFNLSLPLTSVSKSEGTNESWLSTEVS